MFLQVGINGQSERQSHAEEFYLRHIRAVLSTVWNGKGVACSRKPSVVYGFIPCDAATSHCALEKLHGSNGLYFCGDYMFASAMPTSMLMLRS